MKKAFSVVRVILTVLLCVLVVLNLWTLYARLVRKDAQPKLFGFSKAVVLSGSMAPEFFTGDLLVLRAQDQYQVGDVIMFHRDGDFVTHRIVAETPQGFITRGDANNTDDAGAVKPADIEGAMLLSIPRAGTVLSALQSPQTIFLLFLVILCASKLPDLHKRVQEKEVEAV